MNNQCSRCYGMGYEEYEEDYGRTVRDTCYHCSGSGKVDEETDFQDKLGDVAYTLATGAVYKIIQSCNSDPDGEGWNFRAAENMMSERDYTMGYIDDYQAHYLNDLLDMDRGSQELMVAWNNYEG